MSILKYIKREWNIIFIHKEVVRQTVARECIFGHTNPENNVEEGICTHMKNSDPSKTKFFKHGRCVEDYCPIRESILTYVGK